VGGSPNRPPSTVIGEKKGKAAGESDLELTLEGDSRVSGRSGGKSAAGASDVLASTSGSHILGPSETPPVPSGKFEDLDEIDIDLDTESSKIQSDLNLPKSPRAKAAEEESDLRLVESGIHGRKSPGRKDRGEDSEIRLAEDEDDDMVLSESGGSDITLSAGDSGINLVSPSDSGLALDDLDLDLAGSGVSSFEIEEAAEKIVLEEEPARKGKAAGKDDDFLLTPLGEPGEEDSSSQVIELDSAADLQESEALMERPQETAILEPVEDELGPAVITSPTAATVTTLAAPVEFSGANVAFLILCLIILGICGIMMLDMLRHIWSWGQPFSVNTWLIDSLNFFA
jgi:hypothetical protein